MLRSALITLCAIGMLAVSGRTAWSAARSGTGDDLEASGGAPIEDDPATLELRAARNAELKAVGAAGRAVLDKDVKPFPSLPAMAAKYDIPIVYTGRVSWFIDFFKGPGRQFYSTWLARSSRFIPLFREVLQEHGVPRDLVYLAMVESGFAMQAVSPVGATGPWQFMEPTGKQYGLRRNFWVDERRDPVKATHAAARYLKDLHQKWNDWYLAWAEYNSGPWRIAKGIEKHGTRNFWTLAAGDTFLDETKNYVPKIIAAALVAKHAEIFGFETVRWHSRFEFDLVELSNPVELSVLASCVRSSEEVLRDLNPELLRRVTPPMSEGVYEFRVPKGRADDFKSCILPTLTVKYRKHVVQRGETIRKIGQQHRTEPMDIVALNRLEGRAPRVGEQLVIPEPL